MCGKAARGAFLVFGGIWLSMLLLRSSLVPALSDLWPAHAQLLASTLARTSMEWSGLTRIGSSPLQIHIGFVSSHAKQIEHRKLSSGKAPSQSARGCSEMHGHRSGTSSIMEPGVANREGKGAIRTAENEKSHSQNSANPPGADHKCGLWAKCLYTRVVHGASKEVPTARAPACHDLMDGPSSIIIHAGVFPRCRCCEYPIIL